MYLGQSFGTLCEELIKNKAYFLVEFFCFYIFFISKNINTEHTYLFTHYFIKGEKPFSLYYDFEMNVQNPLVFQASNKCNFEQKVEKNFPTKPRIFLNISNWR